MKSVRVSVLVLWAQCHVPSPYLPPPSASTFVKFHKEVLLGLFGPAASADVGNATRRLSDITSARKTAIGLVNAFKPAFFIRSSPSAL